MRKEEIRFHKNNQHSQYQRQVFNLSEPIRNEMSFERQNSAQRRTSTLQSWKNAKIGKQQTIILDKPVNLKQLNQENDVTTYKISLWKVDLEEPSYIISSQILKVAKQTYILANKLNFSQDGKYIYLILVNGENSALWKCVTLDS